jgi:hypothetical protein
MSNFLPRLLAASTATRPNACREICLRSAAPQNPVEGLIWRSPITVLFS